MGSDTPSGVYVISILMFLTGIAVFYMVSSAVIPGSLQIIFVIAAVVALVGSIALWKKTRAGWYIAVNFYLFAILFELFNLWQYGRGSVVSIIIAAVILWYLHRHKDVFNSSFLFSDRRTAK